MKRQLAIALGLAVVSTSALASKARLESLGQDANGSQVIDDHRSIFLNAAHLNHHKDFVMIEVGNTAGTAATADQDAVATPKAEGGVFKSSGNMVYGVYFGEESNTSNELRKEAGITNNALMEDNSTTLFVAGDAGVQWGAALTHQAYENEASEDKAGAMRARFGVISGNFDVFANIGLSNTVEQETDGSVADVAEFTGKSSYDIGVTFNAGADAQYMFRTNSILAENKDGDEFTKSSMALGASKGYKLNDKAMMWAQVWYKTAAQENFSKVETKTAALPVTISLEADATDWMALRGFVTKNLFIGHTELDSGDKVTNDGLAHGIGASLKYGDLSIDGSLVLVGNNTGNTGAINLDEPMNRVSLTYNF
jgi:hypothetical protein